MIEIVSRLQVKKKKKSLPNCILIILSLAKLFYLKHDDQSLISYIDASIHHLEQLLGVASIDTFVVSFADNESCVEKTWKDLEAYHHDGRIRKLGVSDFDTARLKALYDNPSLTVKPSLNQVNIENCCSNQKELIELGKQYGIEMTFNVDTAGTQLFTLNSSLSSLYLYLYRYLNN